MPSRHKIRISMTYGMLPGVVIFIFICSLLILSPAPASGEPLKGSEYDVKLGFLYNFINFTTWPESAFKNSPKTMTVCFASNNPSSSAVFKLDGTQIKGRKIKVMAFDAEKCLEKSHVLFFATQDKVFIKQVLDLTKGRSILTIGEVEGFTHIGGIINFFVDRSKLRFQINTDASRRSGLKMSSQLLGSAQIVKEDNE